jgi:hypothetical protein
MRVLPLDCTSRGYVGNLMFVKHLFPHMETQCLKSLGWLRLSVRKSSNFKQLFKSYWQGKQLALSHILERVACFQSFPQCTLSKAKPSV